MKKLFDISIGQSGDIPIEGTCRGDILISMTGEGSFSGDRLKGKVLPVGACTTYSPERGINIIDSPVLLETDDGAKLLMQMKAYLHLSGEMENRMIAGEHISPDEYYYKGTVSFCVGEQKYKWLENRLFTCEGIIDSWEALRFNVYEA